MGYNTGVDVKRNHLERQLQQLRTERRAAELRTWDDLVRLRKELREAVREYESKKRSKCPSNPKLSVNSAKSSAVQPHPPSAGSES